VFIPTYNGAPYVREAVESVVDNGFADLEVVVLDDGSTDSTVRIVESMQHPAIHIARNIENIGVVKTRRRGVELIRGRYLALLDQDDIAIPGRFEAQVDRLETAGGPDIVGGAIENFGDFAFVKSCYTSNAAIRSALLFNAPIANPAACLKTAPLRAGLISYSVEAGPAADYALWADATLAGLRLENLERVVTRYRRHAASMTHTHIDEMLACACRVRKRIVDAYYPGFSEAERTAIVNAIAGGFDSLPIWRNEIYALSRAAAEAKEIPEIDYALMLRLLSDHAIQSITNAVKHGAVTSDMLESMAEENSFFEQWRAAENGALDIRIMELFY
jgi:glycosyltransferase involved in cell wall biosynthesis